MLKAGWYAVVALATAALGCGGDDAADGTPYDTLFDAPANAQVTSGSIYGVWSTHIEYDDASVDARFKFAPDSVTAANRCHYSDGFAVTVGITTAATVTASEITVRESKDDTFNDGTHRCNVFGRPAKSPYTIDGERMTLGDLQLLKISD